jgi:hypothetical protein
MKKTGDAICRECAKKISHGEAMVTSDPNSTDGYVSFSLAFTYVTQTFCRTSMSRACLIAFTTNNSKKQ